jgi:predicted enzyme involved in methoxymalonyl-ACP biosynthesis
MLAELATAARSEGARRLVGEYIPTVRNGLVADHYKKLRFAIVEQRGDGSEVWALQLDDYEAPELPFRYVRGSAQSGPAMQVGE